MCREVMQGLKAQNEKEEFNYHIQFYVTTIYDSAIHLAKKSPHTKYYYAINNRFVVNNINTILQELNTLFPDCLIKHAIMASDIYGNLYDVSTLTDEELKNVDYALNNSYIIIDWS